MPARFLSRRKSIALRLISARSFAAVVIQRPEKPIALPGLGFRLRQQASAAPSRQTSVGVWGSGRQGRRPLATAHSIVRLCAIQEPPPVRVGIADPENRRIRELKFMVPEFVSEPAAASGSRPCRPAAGGCRHCLPAMPTINLRRNPQIRRNQPL